MRYITEQIVSKFGLHLYEEEKSNNTIEKYMRDIKFFREWLNDRCVDKSVVLKYKEQLCTRYASKSVNSILSSLNALFIFLNWYDLKVKTIKIQRRLFSDKEKELTKPEYERLLKAAKSKQNDRLYYLMQTLASTGLRISELKYVTVEAVSVGQVIVNCKGKIRQVFLTPKLCKMLKSYIKNKKTGPVFATRTGKPLDRSTVWKMLKNLCESANVARCKVFPHNFRHLFARTFYSLQKDIVRLADVLGHSSVETSRIYTIESGDIHKMQLQKLGLLQV